MKRRGVLASVAALALGTGLAGCTSSSQQEAPMDMTAVRADLQTVSKARILFGHQSVGRNVLAGVQSLAQEAGVPLRIEEPHGLPSDTRPGLFHALIGVNGDPSGKIAAFSQLLNRPERPAYDAAMMELCYEDFGRGAQGQAGLLERYAASVRDLSLARPDVRLVHVSVPLRSDPPGWKTTVKRFLGRETDEDADNALRNAYNASLRARFAHAPLFDVAGVESTEPDGTRSSFVHNGDTVYTLALEYTTDGGHLNEAGRRRAAAEFLHTLALALRQGAKGSKGD